MIASTALLVAAVLSQAGSPRILAVDPARSSLTYGIVHKLHKVGAESKAAEGKVAILPDGKVQVMVRAPIGSFRSGDANRDEHMLEVLEVGNFSHVTFKGIAQAESPKTLPAVVDLSVRGELELHGRKLPQTIGLKVELVSPTEAHVQAGFSVSLDAYEVERPSLLFMKIDDACAIGVDLFLQEAK